MSEKAELAIGNRGCDKLNKLGAFKHFGDDRGIWAGSWLQRMSLDLKIGVLQGENVIHKVKRGGRQD